MAVEEERDPLPPPPLPGYAPRLCASGPAHYARRDIAAGVWWRCVTCNLTWRTP